MSDPVTIKQVTHDGSFTVVVEMSDGRQYPFRTHPLAARLFATAPALHRACEEAFDWLDHHGAAGAGSDDEPGFVLLMSKLAAALKAVGP